MERGRVYPNEEHLGRKCEFWDTQRRYCSFPKVSMVGRISCGGVIDELCLYTKDNRPIEHPEVLADDLQRELHAIDVSAHLVDPDLSTQGGA